jgi:hypothetical protein
MAASRPILQPIRSPTRFLYAGITSIAHPLISTNSVCKVFRLGKILEQRSGNAEYVGMLNKVSHHDSDFPRESLNNG